MSALIIDEKQIERGKQLRSLLELPEAQPLLAEIRDRIATFDGRLDGMRRDTHEDRIILSALDRKNELKDLLGWIDQEIEAGGREIMRKASAEEPLG